ncbi:MAG: sulfatase-like hydrolase/transferase [Candidatus Zixiibacteriota bacterium]|jgi:arylsulfatase A-like enzyme
MARVSNSLKAIGAFVSAVVAAGLAFGLLEAVSARIATLATCVPPDDFVASAITRAKFYTAFAVALGAVIIGLSAAVKALVGRRKPFSPGRLGIATIFGSTLALNVFWFVIAYWNINIIRVSGHEYRLIHPDGFFIFAFPIMVIAVAAFTVLLYFVFGRIKNPKRSLFYGAGVAVIGWATLGVWYLISRPERAEANPGNPDVIFITLDAWRADSWQGKRQGRKLMPNLTAFSKDACIFKNARVQASWTLPSVASFLTSQYPAVHGAKPNRRVGTKQAILAEVLAAHGYETFATTGNDLCLPNSGLMRGFDDYYYWDSKPALKALGYYETYAFYLALRAHRKETTDKHITTILTDEIMRQLERPRKKPFFLWAHYLDPHSPYEPQQRYTTIPIPSNEELWDYPRKKRFRINRQLYFGELRYVDEELGRVFELLEKRPNTLVIISSDHGEEFGERFEKGPRDNYDIRGHGHGHTVFDEVLRVPLIMKFPDRRTCKVDAGVGLIDVAPTILDYVGIVKPLSMQGRSLLPVIEGRAEEEPVFAGPTQLYDGKKEAVYFRGRKLIYDWAKEEYFYFDLENDPGEKNPLDPNSPEANGMKDRLNNWREQNRRFAEAFETGDEGADLEGAMRALGYVE